MFLHRIMSFVKEKIATFQNDVLHKSTEKKNGLQNKHVQNNFDLEYNKFNAPYEENSIRGDSCLHLLEKLYLAKENMIPVIDEIINNASIFTNTDFKRHPNCALCSVSAEQFAGALRASRILNEVNEDLNRVEQQRGSPRFELPATDVIVNTLCYSDCAARPETLGSCDRVYIDKELIKQLIELHEFLGLTIYRLREIDDCCCPTGYLGPCPKSEPNITATQPSVVLSNVRSAAQFEEEFRSKSRNLVVRSGSKIPSQNVTVSTPTSTIIVQPSQQEVQSSQSNDVRAYPCCCYAKKSKPKSQVFESPPLEIQTYDGISNGVYEPCRGPCFEYYKSQMLGEHQYSSFKKSQSQINPRSVSVVDPNIGSTCVDPCTRQSHVDSHVGSSYFIPNVVPSATEPTHLPSHQNYHGTSYTGSSNGAPYNESRMSYVDPKTGSIVTESRTSYLGSQMHMSTIDQNIPPSIMELDPCRKELAKLQSEYDELSNTLVALKHLSASGGSESDLREKINNIQIKKSRSTGFILAKEVYSRITDLVTARKAILDCLEELSEVRKFLKKATDLEIDLENNVQLSQQPEDMECCARPQDTHLHAKLNGIPVVLKLNQGTIDTIFRSIASVKTGSTEKEAPSLQEKPRALPRNQAVSEPHFDRNYSEKEFPKTVRAKSLDERLLQEKTIKHESSQTSELCCVNSLISEESTSKEVLKIHKSSSRDNGPRVQSLSEPLLAKSRLSSELQVQEDIQDKMSYQKVPSQVSSKSLGIDRGSARNVTAEPKFSRDIINYDIKPKSSSEAPALQSSIRKLTKTPSVSGPFRSKSIQFADLHTSETQTKTKETATKSVTSDEDNLSLKSVDSTGLPDAKSRSKIELAIERSGIFEEKEDTPEDDVDEYETKILESRQSDLAAETLATTKQLSNVNIGPGFDETYKDNGEPKITSSEKLRTISARINSQCTAKQNGRSNKMSLLSQPSDTQMRTVPLEIERDTAPVAAKSEEKPPPIPPQPQVQEDIQKEPKTKDQITETVLIRLIDSKLDAEIRDKLCICREERKKMLSKETATNYEELTYATEATSGPGLEETPLKKMPFEEIIAATKVDAKVSTSVPDSPLAASSPVESSVDGFSYPTVIERPSKKLNEYNSDLYAGANVMRSGLITSDDLLEETGKIMKTPEQRAAEEALLFESIKQEMKMLEDVKYKKIKESIILEAEEEPALSTTRRYGSAYRGSSSTDSSVTVYSSKRTKDGQRLRLSLTVSPIPEGEYLGPADISRDYIKSDYTESDPAMPYVPAKASLPEFAAGNLRIESTGQAIAPRTSSVYSQLRTTAICHPKQEVECGLKDIGLDNLIKACRPAKCCRKSVINEKAHQGLPYPASLMSLPLDEEDVKTIKQTVTLEKECNANYIRSSTFQTYHSKFQHYTTFQSGQEFPWAIPSYEIRFFQFFKKEDDKKQQERTHKGEKSACEENETHSDSLAVKFIDFLKKDSKIAHHHSESQSDKTSVSSRKRHKSEMLQWQCDSKSLDLNKYIFINSPCDAESLISYVITDEKGNRKSIKPKHLHAPKSIKHNDSASPLKQNHISEIPEKDTNKAQSLPDPLLDVVKSYTKQQVLNCTTTKSKCSSSIHTQNLSSQHGNNFTKEATEKTPAKEKKNKKVQCRRLVSCDKFSVKDPLVLEKIQKLQKCYFEAIDNGESISMKINPLPKNQILNAKTHKLEKCNFATVDNTSTNNRDDSSHVKYRINVKANSIRINKLKENQAICFDSAKIVPLRSSTSQPDIEAGMENEHLSSSYQFFNRGFSYTAFEESIQSTKPAFYPLSCAQRNISAYYCFGEDKMNKRESKMHHSQNIPHKSPRIFPGNNKLDLSESASLQKSKHKCLNLNDNVKKSSKFISNTSLHKQNTSTIHIKPFNEINRSDSYLKGNKIFHKVQNVEQKTQTSSLPYLKHNSDKVVDCSTSTKSLDGKPIDLLENNLAKNQFIAEINQIIHSQITYKSESCDTDDLLSDMSDGINHERQSLLDINNILEKTNNSEPYTKPSKSTIQAPSKLDSLYSQTSIHSDALTKTNFLKSKSSADSKMGSKQLVCNFVPFNIRNDTIPEETSSEGLIPASDASAIVETEGASMSSSTSNEKLRKSPLKYKNTVILKAVDSTTASQKYSKSHGRSSGYVSVLKPTCGCPEIAVFIPCYCNDKHNNKKSKQSKNRSRIPKLCKPIKITKSVKPSRLPRLVRPQASASTARSTSLRGPNCQAVRKSSHYCTKVNQDY